MSLLLLLVSIKVVSAPDPTRTAVRVPRHLVNPENSRFLSRSVREVEPKVSCTTVDVHAAFPKNVATNQNVIGREVMKHGKVTDELDPILEPK